MVRALALYRQFVSIHLRSQMQYRVSFLFNLAAGFMSMILAFASLALILQRFETVGGWSWLEVIFAYSLAQTAFGFAEVTCEGFAPGSFSRRIRQGQLDQLLLRPVSPLIQILGSRLNFPATTRIIQGLVILGLAINLLHLQWSWLQWLYLPTVIMGGVCFFASLFITGSTISIWTIESTQAFAVLTYGSLRMVAYPMHIYPNWMRRFFTFVVPAIFLNFYPALYLLNKPDPFNFPAFTPLLTPVAGISMLAAAILFWRFGLNRYQSTGS